MVIGRRRIVSPILRDSSVTSISGCVTRRRRNASHPGLLHGRGAGDRPDHQAGLDHRSRQERPDHGQRREVRPNQIRRRRRILHPGCDPRWGLTGRQHRDPARLIDCEDVMVERCRGQKARSRTGPRQLLYLDRSQPPPEAPAEGRGRAGRDPESRRLERRPGPGAFLHHAEKDYLRGSRWNRDRPRLGERLADRRQRDHRDRRGGRGEGIAVTGSRNRILGNRTKNTTAAGILLFATARGGNADNEIAHNLCTDAADQGIALVWGRAARPSRI